MATEVSWRTQFNLINKYKLTNALQPLKDICQVLCKRKWKKKKNISHDLHSRLQRKKEMSGVNELCTMNGQHVYTMSKVCWCTSSSHCNSGCKPNEMTLQYHLVYICDCSTNIKSANIKLERHRNGTLFEQTADKIYKVHFADEISRPNTPMSFLNKNHLFK